MSSDSLWSPLLAEVTNLPEGTTLSTPLSGDAFRISEVQDKSVVICVLNGNDETRQLQRDQFETLYRRVTEERAGFDLDRLPPNAEAYAAVLSLHPRIELDTEAWELRETDSHSMSPIVTIPDERTDAPHRDSDQNDSHTKTKSGTAKPAGDDNDESVVDQMIENMGDPKAQVKCPIEGCSYTHRSAASVARHVSGSSTAKHIWENTTYSGWRDFVRKHGESPG